MMRGLNITEASLRGDYFVDDEGKGSHTQTFHNLLLLPLHFLHNSLIISHLHVIYSFHLKGIVQ